MGAWAKINWSDFYKWLLNYYHHPKVAFFVIPDVVDGGERDNDALINEVPKCSTGRQLRLASARVNRSAYRAMS